MIDITRDELSPRPGGGPMIGPDVRLPVAPSVPSAGNGVAGVTWTDRVLGAAVVVMALVAGLNFTFAVAVMPNMAGADDHTFVATMQRFNENPSFPLSFTAALVLTALAALMQLGPGSRSALRWTVVALVLYAVVLTITAGLHIPLNEQIDRAGDPDLITDLAHVRREFEGPWVVGNIVRTLVCTASVAALGRALLERGRGTGASLPGRPLG
jgi:uncharacterized membrane protein